MTIACIKKSLASLYAKQRQEDITKFPNIKKTQKVNSKMGPLLLFYFNLSKKPNQKVVIECVIFVLSLCSSSSFLFLVHMHDPNFDNLLPLTTYTSNIPTPTPLPLPSWPYYN
jgi:hypothetical protein